MGREGHDGYDLEDAIAASPDKVETKKNTFRAGSWVTIDGRRGTIGTVVALADEKTRVAWSDGTITSVPTSALAHRSVKRSDLHWHEAERAETAALLHAYDCALDRARGGLFHYLEKARKAINGARQQARVLAGFKLGVADETSARECADLKRELREIARAVRNARRMADVQPVNAYMIPSLSDLKEPWSAEEGEYERRRLLDAIKKWRRTQAAQNE